MKYIVKVACFVLLVLFSSAVFDDVNAASLESGKKTGVYLNEIGVGSGYAWGSLKREPVHLTVYPAFVRIGSHEVAGVLVFVILDKKKPIV